MRQTRGFRKPFTSLLLAGFLLGCFASTPQIHEAQAPESNGNVDFVPNVIPWSTVYLKVNKTSNIEGSGDRFRITWENPQRKPWQRQLWSVDFRLQVNATKYRRAGGVWFNDTRMWTVAGFQAMFNATVDYAKNMNETLVQWGVVIDNPDITNEWIHHVWIKMVDTNFPVDLIQLETIDPNPPTQNFTIKRFHLPENLDLSFEDLFYKGYMVDALNLTDVVTYGFYGKTHLNLDPIAFSANTITVTGYTEGTPCTFNDLWLADKAGTKTLKASAVYTDAGSLSLDTQPTPTDYKTLPMEVVVTAVTGTWGVTFVGLDQFGTAISSDTPAINAVGTYASGLTYASIDASGIELIEVIEGSITFSVQQGQWGVVWKQTTSQYAFDAILQVGDGSTTTWFTDTSKQIILNNGVHTAHNQYFIKVKNKATFTIGTLVDATAKRSSSGCTFISHEQIYQDYVIGGDNSGSVIYLYSSSFQSTAPTWDQYIYNYVKRIWNCQFTKKMLMQTQNCDIYNIYSTGSTYVFVSCTNTTMDKVATTTARLIFGGGTVSNVFGYFSTNLAYLNNIAYDSYFINFDVNTWTFTFAGTTTGKVYRQYTVDIVTEPSAVVTLKDKDGNTVFSVTADAVTGAIAQQTVSRGYYNQTGGNTLYDYSPHRLVIEKEGYQTYNQTFTLDEKIDWRIMLEPETSSIASMVPFFLLGCIIILPIGILIAKKH